MAQQLAHPSGTEGTRDGFCPVLIVEFFFKSEIKQFIAKYSEINITRPIAHSENKTKATYMVLL